MISFIVFTVKVFATLLCCAFWLALVMLIIVGIDRMVAR
jgi:hypothetical protein